MPDEDVPAGMAPAADPEPLLVLVAAVSPAEEDGFPPVSAPPVEAPSPFSAPAPTFLSRCLAAVGLVEAASLEDDAHIAEDLPHRRSAGGTGLQWIVLERLDDVEILLAVLAVILVGGQPVLLRLGPLLASSLPERVPIPSDSGVLPYTGQ